MARPVKLKLVAASTHTAGRFDDPLEGDRPSARAAKATVDALSDVQLVALAIDGDQLAAEQLYRRHATFAFNLAARIAGSTHDVEDVVHDAFLRAFDSLETLRNAAAFKGWLGSIVVHAMRSRLRRGRLMRVLGLNRGIDPIELDCIASEDASPRVRAELAQVYALLRTLPADERIAWTLRFVEGHDLKDAAELCGCSLATVKRRIRRAQGYIEQHFVSSDGVSSDGVSTDGVSSDDVSAEAMSGDRPRDEAPRSRRRTRHEEAAS
jgi:RNA polymerase sigma-70 factor (ECF subfamily)